MKILFSSYHNKYFITITEYIEDAIEGTGHELIKFDDRQHILPGRVRSRIDRLNRLDLNNINKKLLTLARETKPDIALIAGGHRISKETVKALRARGILTVLWTIDAPIHFEPILEAASSYDHIFCQGTEAVEILQRAGIKNVNWLPMACSPRYHRPISITSEEKKLFENDIVFIGSYYPNRWETLRRLSGHNMAVWGPGWSKVSKNGVPNRVIHDEKLNYNRWVKIYSAAKIVLIIHFQDRKVPCFQASPKVFETLACGCFALVDCQKDVFSIFKNEVHLVGYSDFRELREKIRYYLDHPDERRRIAAQGRKEVLNLHTFEHRVKELLSVCIV